MKIKINRRRVAACDYLKRGWSIVPVGQKKIPLVPWKEFQKRLPKKSEVIRWIKKWPKLNWAVVTGALSNLVVLDIDPRNGGIDSLHKLCEKYGPFPSTPKVRTGGGGVHLYFKYPGSQVKNATILPGVEIKGDGGLVTLPPSIHQSGRPYKWKLSPSQAALAPLPKWAPNTLITQNYVGNQGQRNSTLTSIAGFLRSKGLDQNGILESLKSVNESLFPDPLEISELTGIANSIGKYPSESDSDAYIPLSAAESKYIQADKLAAEAPLTIDWVWEPFIAKGFVTIISSAPKTGKTTLLNHFLKHLVESRAFLGHEVKPIKKILILTEEHSTLVLRRFQGLDLLKDSILVLLRYKIGDWKEALEQIVFAIKKEKPDLVIIDTLAEFWDVKDENDSQSVMRALKPLKKIVHEFTIAVLLVHHLRKAPGEKGAGHRGSSAITGTADINLELREDQREGVRKLGSRSRFWETPKELIIELKDGKYISHGSAALFTRENVEKRILEILKAAQSWLTKEEIEELLDPKPGNTIIKEILAKSPFLKRKGDGKRGRPHRYQRKLLLPCPPSLKATKTKKPIMVKVRRKSA